MGRGGGVLSCSSALREQDRQEQRTHAGPEQSGPRIIRRPSVRQSYSGVR